MLTFVDLSMDGEWPAIWVTRFTDYHVFYNPEKSLGYLTGKPFGFAGMQMLNANHNPNTWPEVWDCSRTYLAVTLPWGVIPFATNVEKELFRFQNIRHACGVSGGDGFCRFVGCGFAAGVSRLSSIRAMTSPTRAVSPACLRW